MPEKRNLYGCLPCPKCGSVYRCPYDRAEGLVVECDECGLVEPADENHPIAVERREEG